MDIFFSKFSFPLGGQFLRGCTYPVFPTPGSEMRASQVLSLYLLREGIHVARTAPDGFCPLGGFRSPVSSAASPPPTPTFLPSQLPFKRGRAGEAGVN